MTLKSVIKPKYLPTFPPTWQGVVLWLLLDRLQAVGWVHGVCWTLFGLVWVSCLYARIWGEKDVHPADLPQGPNP